jgi:hypothetical protein
MLQKKIIVILGFGHLKFTEQAGVAATQGLAGTPVIVYRGFPKSLRWNAR